MSAGQCDDLGVLINRDAVSDTTYSATVSTTGSVSLNRECTKNTHTKSGLRGGVQGRFSVPVYACDSFSEPYRHGKVTVTLNTSANPDPAASADVIVVPFMELGFMSNRHPEAMTAAAGAAGGCRLQLADPQTDQFLGLLALQGGWRGSDDSAHVLWGTLITGHLPVKLSQTEPTEWNRWKAIADPPVNPGKNVVNLLTAIAAAGLSHSSGTHCMIGAVTGLSSKDGPIRVSANLHLTTGTGESEVQTCQSRFTQYEDYSTSCYVLTGHLRWHEARNISAQFAGDYQFNPGPGGPSVQLSFRERYP